MNDFLQWILNNPGWSFLIGVALFLAAWTGWPKRMGRTLSKVAMLVGAVVAIPTGIMFLVAASGGAGALVVAEDSSLSPSGVGSLDCGDVTSTTEGITVRNIADSTLSYASNTYYFQNAKTDELEETGSASTVGTPVTETLNPCTEYKIETLTNRGSTGVAKAKSGQSLSFTTGKVGTTHDLEAYNLSTISVVVVDQRTFNDAENLYEDGTTGGDANQTSLTVLNATSVQEDAAGTAIAVGADGTVEYSIELHSASATTYGSDPNTKLWACLDVGSDNEWAAPTVSINGMKLEDHRDQIDADSKKGSLVNTADYCYIIPQPISDAAQTLRFSISAPGQNPDTSNDDLTWAFLSEGTYLSSKVPNLIKTGIYTDASTPALVTYDATRSPSLIFQIS